MNNEQILKDLQEAIEEFEPTKDLVLNMANLAGADGVVCLAKWKLAQQFDTYNLALRFMQKMMGEPSEGVINHGNDFACCSESEFADVENMPEVFQEMVNKALTELETSDN